MVFRNFLGNNFFSVGPPLVGNGDLVGFWQNLGLGHLENSGPGPKTEKRNFLVLGVPKRAKNYHAVRDGCAQFSYRLRFDRPDPHGWEYAKYDDFRPSALSPPPRLPSLQEVAAFDGDEPVLSRRDAMARLSMGAVTVGMLSRKAEDTVGSVGAVRGAGSVH